MNQVTESEQKVVASTGGVTAIKVILTDGGASTAGVKQRADCTVRATAVILGIPYIEADSRLRLLGRKRGAGFHFEKVATYYRMTMVPTPDVIVAKHEVKPLREWLPALQKGRFAVIVKRHVFAVIDGVIYDSFCNGLNQHVLKVYQYGDETN